MMVEHKFSVTIPAEISKADDGQWRVYGLASSGAKDLQGEVVDPNGLDLSPIETGRGVFNFDHKKGPENVIGIIDKAQKDEKGLYLGGYLFKNHDRAKAVHQIMSSLGKSERGRMGMSIEGVVQERSGADGKTIKKAKITSCALTLNPVNTETYVDLVKSFEGVEFETGDLSESILPEEKKQVEGEPTEKSISFSVEQVAALLKSLGVGGEYASTTPAQRTQGAALAQEDLDGKKCKKCMSKACKCPKKLKKMDKGMYKSAFLDIIQDLKKLHPEVPTSELFEAVKDRLNTKFPTLKI